MKSPKNKALIKVFPFRLSSKEIKTLSEDQQAILGLANYAASELNVLQRTYISFSYDLSGDAWFDATVMIQRNTLLRVWSAKLFEFIDCIESLSRKTDLEKSVKELISKATDGISGLKAHTAYGLVRCFRHESTNHYSFKAAKKNLKHLPDHSDCNMYLHEMDGNSCYPMGEELMFIGRLNRHGANLSTKEEVAEQLDDWMQWNLEANRWVREFHVLTFEVVVDGKIPDRFARETWKWVDPMLVSDVSTPSSPLFFRKPKP